MRPVTDPDGARPIGPYSPALRAGQLLWISGQIPVDPATGQMESGDVAAQTRRALQNLGALLTAAGLSFGHVARTTVFLADLNDYAAMNEVYGSFFQEPYPTRSTIQAGALPRGARVEIDAVAIYEADSDASDD